MIETIGLACTVEQRNRSVMTEVCANASARTGRITHEQERIGITQGDRTSDGERRTREAAHQPEPESKQQTSSFSFLLPYSLTFFSLNYSTESSRIIVLLVMSSELSKCQLVRRGHNKVLFLPVHHAHRLPFTFCILPDLSE